MSGEESPPLGFEQGIQGARLLSASSDVGPGGPKEADMTLTMLNKINQVMWLWQSSILVLREPVYLLL